MKKIIGFILVLALIEALLIHYLVLQKQTKGDFFASQRMQTQTSNYLAAICTISTHPASSRKTSSNSPSISPSCNKLCTRTRQPEMTSDASSSRNCNPPMNV